MAVITGVVFGADRTRGVLLGVLLLAVVRCTTPAAGLACEDVAPFFQDKGFSTGLLPRSPTNGSLCGKRSCCGSMEEELPAKTMQQLSTFVQTTLHRTLSLLDKKARKFDAIFREMMDKSKKEFDEMFKKTYGLIYMQNSEVFTDFFGELESYYDKGNSKLSDVLDNFFTILYQRMFKVLNAQYKFDDKYMTCVAEHMAELKPFGDVPNKLGVQLRRSFVATRTFYKALTGAVAIVSKMVNFRLHKSCAQDMARMQYCGYCSATDAAPPSAACFQYCNAVAATCLKDYMAINGKWNDLVDALDKVSDRLLGPFNIEMVVEPINIKISDAVMNFQESGAEISKKLFSGCGVPTLGRRKRATRGAKKVTKDEISFQPLYTNGAKKKLKHKKENKHSDDDRMSILEKHIRDIKQTVKDTRELWSYLPVLYCNNDSMTTSAPTCWNGTTTTENASTTPTPTSGFTPPAVQEQTFNLEVWIGKLQNAYQGQEVDMADDSEESLLEGSGSGSGDSPLDTSTTPSYIPETSSLSNTVTNGDSDTNNSLVGNSGDTSNTVPGGDDLGNGSTNDNSVDDSGDSSRKPPGTSSGDSSPIPDEDEDLDVFTDIDAATPKGKADEDIRSTSGASQPLPSLTRALVQYILPIVFVCFGGAISDLL